MVFVVPSLLVSKVQAEPLPARLAWLAELEDTVHELEQRWSLILGSPFEPGGQTAWVAPARDRAGRDLVLKVGWAHPEAEHEPEGLRAWHGSGTVQIFDACRLGQSSALLLERCDPGTCLSDLRAENEQDEIVAGLLRRLWPAPSAGFGFRPLAVMCQAWAEGFHRRLAATPGNGRGIDPGLARAGAEMFTALPDTAQREVLLCTDLHAGNVLAAQREPWLVIDPKPFVGDPCYDVLQHLLNCERLTADPAGLARRMADLVELDPTRVTQWLFARCVIESVDNPRFQAVATALAPT